MTHEYALQKDKLYYLASPYTNKSETIRNSNFKSVCLLAGKLIQDGYKIFCPIAMSHPIAAYCNMETTFTDWRDLDLFHLERCDGLLVAELPGFTASTGVKAEIQRAVELHMTVNYIACDFIYEYVLQDFIDELNKCMEHGAKKHGSDNWKYLDGKKSSHRDMHASMFRHLAASHENNREDSESKLDPLVHLATRALMTVWRKKRGMI